MQLHPSLSLEIDVTHPVMINSTTKSRLSVAHGTLDGRSLVVACGYNDKGEFGYFICSETVHPGSPPIYQYTNIVSFTKKTSEGTFQHVLKRFQQMIH